MAAAPPDAPEACDATHNSMYWNDMRPRARRPAAGFALRHKFLYYLPRMAQSKAVLLVSYQAAVFAPHAEALTAAGFAVTHAATMSAALGAVGPGKFELLVLAPNIPAGDRRRVEAEAKRRNRNIRIVLFYAGERERDVFASALLDISIPPADLVRTATELLAPTQSEAQG